MFFRLRPGPDMKESFQRWRAFLLEKKRRRAAVRCAAALQRCATLVPVLTPSPLRSMAVEHCNRCLLLGVFSDWRSAARSLFRERMNAELDARWADAAQSEAQKFGLIVARLESQLADARCVTRTAAAAKGVAAS